MKRILNSRLFSVFLIFLFLALANGLVNIDSQKRLIDKDRKSYQKKISEARENNENLERFLNYYGDPSFLEKEARIRLNYKVADEQVAFIYKDDTANVSSVSFAETIKKMHNYKKWGYWLMGY